MSVIADVATGRTGPRALCGTARRPPTRPPDPVLCPRRDPWLWPRNWTLTSSLLRTWTRKEKCNKENTIGLLKVGHFLVDRTGTDGYPILRSPTILQTQKGSVAPLGKRLVAGLSTGESWTYPRHRGSGRTGWGTHGGSGVLPGLRSRGTTLGGRDGPRVPHGSHPAS